MHAATLESRNPVRLCVKPFQESVKQPNTAETELVQRLKAGGETTFREIVERFGPNSPWIMQDSARHQGVKEESDCGNRVRQVGC